MATSLTVYQSHESRPDDDCWAATAVVAAASRSRAVEALRSVGFAARHVRTARGGSAEERAGLSRPGTVLWCDWHDGSDDRAWRER